MKLEERDLSAQDKIDMATDPEMPVDEFPKPAVDSGKLKPEDVFEKKSPPSDFKPIELTEAEKDNARRAFEYTKAHRNDRFQPTREAHGTVLNEHPDWLTPPGRYMNPDELDKAWELLQEHKKRSGGGPEPGEAANPADEPPQPPTGGTEPASAATGPEAASPTAAGAGAISPAAPEGGATPGKAGEKNPLEDRVKGVEDRLEAMEKQLEQINSALAERGKELEKKAEEASKSPERRGLLDRWKAVGEKIQKMPTSTKVAIGVGLVAAGLAGGGIAAAAGVGGAVWRGVASSATFVMLEKALRSGYEVEGVDKRTNVRKAVHTAGALFLSVLLGSGITSQVLSGLLPTSVAEAAFNTLDNGPVPEVAQGQSEMSTGMYGAGNEPELEALQKHEGAVPSGLTAEDKLLEQQRIVDDLANGPGGESPAPPDEAKLLEQQRIADDLANGPGYDPNDFDRTREEIEGKQGVVGPERVSLEPYEVQKEDTLYKIIKTNFPEIGEGLSGGKQTNAIENILAEIKKDPQAYGVVSGNVDKLAVGDSLDLEGIRQIIEQKKIGGVGIIEHAQNLSASTASNIESYVPPSSGVTEAAADSSKMTTGIYGAGNVPEEAATLAKGAQDARVVDDLVNSSRGVSRPEIVGGPDDLHHDTDEGVVPESEDDFSEKHSGFTDRVKFAEPSTIPSDGKPVDYFDRPELAYLNNPTGAEEAGFGGRTIIALEDTKTAVNTTVNSIFGERSFLGDTAGVDSREWQGVKGMAINQFLAQENTSPASKKLQEAVFQLYKDTELVPWKYEKVESYLNRAMYSALTRNKAIA